MHYFVTYQRLAKGEARPSDDDDELFQFGEGKTEVEFLPNVGDFVRIDRSSIDGNQGSITGRVRSRLFNYLALSAGTNCLINIVLEETDDNWSKLIKE